MSAESSIELSSEEVRILVDLGFIAVMRSLGRQADALFKGVRAARPGEDAGYIGEALRFMQAGEVGAAVALLRQRPPSDANRLFLGMALLRSGDRAEAQVILQDVIKTAREPAHVDTARNLLEADEVDRQFLPR